MLIYCSISLTPSVDPRLFPLESNSRVKEIEQYDSVLIVHQYMYLTLWLLSSMLCYSLLLVSDSGYNDKRSYITHILTAWVPLLDANETNGCLQVKAGFVLKLC